MAKNVLTLRVSDEKKAEWLSRAQKAGMKLGPWIESMCDLPGPKEFAQAFSAEHEKAMSALARPASAKDIKDAIGITAEDEAAAHRALVTDQDLLNQMARRKADQVDSSVVQVTPTPQPPYIPNIQSGRPVGKIAKAMKDGQIVPPLDKATEDVV